MNWIRFLVDEVRDILAEPTIVFLLGVTVGGAAGALALVVRFTVYGAAPWMCR